MMQNNASDLLGRNDASPLNGARRELEAVLERARDERFRLVRIIKSYESKLADAASPVPAESLARLHSKIDQLDKAIDGRFDQLHDVEGNVDRRMAQIHELEKALGQSVAAFEQRLEASKNFGATIEAGKKEVRTIAGEVAREVRQQLADVEVGVMKKLEQLDTIDDHVCDKLDSVGRTVDDYTNGLIGDLVEKAKQGLQPLRLDLAKHAEEQIDVIDRLIAERIAGLDVDVDEALKPLTDRFASVFENAHKEADSIENRLEEHIGKVIEQSLGNRLEEMVQKRLSTAEAEMQDAVDRTVMQKVDAILSEQDAAMRRKVEAVERRAAELRARLETAADHQAEQLDAAAAAGRERRDELIAQINQHQDEASRKLQSAREVVEQSARQVASQRASLDAAAREAELMIEKRSKELVQTAGREAEAAIAERITEIEEATSRRGDAAIRSVEAKSESIRKEMREQVVGLMSKADDLMRPFGERIDGRLEELAGQAEQGIARLEQRLTEWSGEQSKAAVAAIKQAIDAAEAEAAGMSDRMAERADHLQAIRQRMTEMLAVEREQAARDIETTTADLQQQLAQARKSINGARKAAQSETFEITELMAGHADKLEQVRLQMSALIEAQTGEIDGELQQAVENLQGRLDGAMQQVEICRESVESEIEDVDGLVASHASKLSEAQRQMAAAFEEQSDAAEKQIDEACEQLRETAGSTIAGIEMSVREELERVSQMHAEAAERSRQETGRLAASCESQIQRVDQHVEERFARMEAAQVEAGERFAEAMDELTAKAEQKAEELEAIARERVAPIDEQYADADRRGREMIEQLRADAMAAIEPMQKLIDAQLDSFKHHMSSAMSAARNEASAAKSAVEQLVAPSAEHRATLEAELQEAQAAREMLQSLSTEALDQVRQTLDDAREQVRREASQALDEAMRVASDRVDAIASEAEARTTPLTEAAAARIGELEQQGQDIVNAAQDRLAEHVNALRESSEAMIDMLVSQLDRRIASLKPRAAEQLDDADHLIRQRLDQVARALEATRAATGNASTPDMNAIVSPIEAQTVDTPDVQTAENLEGSIYEMANKVVKTAAGNKAA